MFECTALYEIIHGEKNRKNSVNCRDCKEINKLNPNRVQY